MKEPNPSRWVRPLKGRGNQRFSRPYHWYEHEGRIAFAPIQPQRFPMYLDRTLKV